MNRVAISSLFLVVVACHGGGAGSQVVTPLSTPPLAPPSWIDEGDRLELHGQARIFGVGMGPSARAAESHARRTALARLEVFVVYMGAQSEAESMMRLGPEINEPSLARVLERYRQSIANRIATDRTYHDGHQWYARARIQWDLVDFDAFLSEMSAEAAQYRRHARRRHSGIWPIPSASTSLKAVGKMKCSVDAQCATAGTDGVKTLGVPQRPACNDGCLVGTILPRL